MATEFSKRTAVYIVIRLIVASGTGKSVGSILVPTPWLETHSHKHGEFILLSTRVENTEGGKCKRVYEKDPERPNTIFSYPVKHTDDCEH